jgi:hypothetical protein
MSRFTQWFVGEHLRRMGWPKENSISRQQYVDSSLVDIVVEQAIEISVALGVGRPRIGVALLADIFIDNPWTKESTLELVQTLTKEVTNLQYNADLFPWQDLCKNIKIAQQSEEITWQQLGNPVLSQLWSITTASGVFWGLTHVNEMEVIFNNMKIHYEKTAPFWASHGLQVSTQYPWKSLEQYFESCEDFIRLFESVRPRLCEIPIELADNPVISCRIKSVK